MKIIARNHTVDIGKATLMVMPKEKEKNSLCSDLFQCSIHKSDKNYQKGMDIISILTTHPNI